MDPGLDDDFLVWEITSARDFWAELEDYTVVPDDASLAQLDTACKTFVRLCAQYHVSYLSEPEALKHACEVLVASDLFSFHSARMQSLLVSLACAATDPHQLFIVYSLLLHYGAAHPVFYRTSSNYRSLLPLLIETIQHVDDGYFGGDDDGTGLPPIEVRLRTPVTLLMFEVCRVQRVEDEDLALFDEAFLDHIFDLVELTRDEADESFNYSLIKLLTALNEQFMIHTLPPTSHHHHQPKQSRAPPPPASAAVRGNLVLHVLTRRLGASKTFGENLIFILNRASDTAEDLCVKLLVLKILFLLFTTVGTQDYFYTNDLRVLVDVFIRELVDLPDESEALRHTYLRVLHPLLTNTQLRRVPYKRAQIRRILLSLVANADIRDVSSTTRRLVDRCLKAEWCVELERATAPLPELIVASGSSASTQDLASPSDSSNARSLGKSRSVEQMSNLGPGARSFSVPSSTGQSKLDDNLASRQGRSSSLDVLAESTIDSPPTPSSSQLLHPTAMRPPSGSRSAPPTPPPAGQHRRAAPPPPRPRSAFKPGATPSPHATSAPSPALAHVRLHTPPPPSSDALPSRGTDFGMTRMPAQAPRQTSPPTPPLELDLELGPRASTVIS